MPNPAGVNGFQGFAPEPAYGDKLRQDALERSAPTPKNPAMDAPRRAQRTATRSRGSPAPNVAPPAPAPPDPQMVTVQAWQEIAGLAGASDLVKMYAARARG